jgi:hypothetical protein
LIDKPAALLPQLAPLPANVLAIEQEQEQDEE